MTIELHISLQPTLIFLLHNSKIIPLSFVLSQIFPVYLDNIPKCILYMYVHLWTVEIQIFFIVDKWICI